MRSGLKLRRRPSRAAVFFLLFTAAAAVWSVRESQSTAAAQSGPLQPGPELLTNPGFEEAGSPAPQGWFRDTAKNGNKGEVAQDASQPQSGRYSLKLTPNGRNDANNSLAVGQAVAAGAYRGKQVQVSAYLRAEGGATAVLGVLSIAKGRLQNLQAQTHAGADFQRVELLYDVPNENDAQVIVACSVSGKSGAAWFDEVSMKAMVTGSAAAPAPATTVAPMPAATVSTSAMKAAIDIDTRRVLRQIPRQLFGIGAEWVWNSYGMWLEQQRQPDPRIVDLAKQMGVAMIRYPGGAYGDFYDWRKGVGPVEKRPLMQHEAAKDDQSRANFGTDEALQFADAIGAEVLITVNAASGSARDAADWVAYLNRPRRRVRYFEVSNELYINDGGPNAKAISIDANTYAKRFLDFAKAMRAADPAIQILGISGVDYGRYRFMRDRDWNRILLEQAGSELDLIAVHNSYAPVNVSNSDSFDKIYKSMLAAPRLVAQNLQTIAEQIDRYGGARASRINIAVTEWGPLFQMDPAGRWVLHGRTMASALHAASLLKTYIESPRTVMAAAHTLHDLNIMGFIGSRNDQFPPQPDWYPTPRAFSFQMFARYFGPQLVASQVQSPTFDSPGAGLIDPVAGVPYLESVSSLSEDGRKLWVMVINKSLDTPVEATIRLQGFVPSGKALTRTLTGAAPDATTGTKPLAVPGVRWGRQAGAERNSRIDQGSPSEVSIQEGSLAAGESFSHRFPAHSVTSIELNRR